MGITNAALLGGIATSETGLAHCNSEVSFGCPGPASPSCGGDPVIAGGADGPCSAQQGGLGMFQFDAGTYADTIATYGDQILTLDGNTRQAVAFVIDKVEQDVDGAGDWLSAAEWINSVPMDAKDPKMKQWAGILACRYNGCCSASSTCTTRANGYRDNAIAVYQEMGAAFWKTSDRCKALPSGGVIEQRTECYVAGGDPRSWRTDDGGMAGLEWTYGDSAAAPASFAVWKVAGVAPGRYRVEAFVDAPAALQPVTKTAKYEVAHDGTFDDVVVDQSAATGWTAIGEFRFAGTGDEHVLLGDDTGDALSAQVRVVFDAVRLVALDVGGSGGSGSGGGGMLHNGGCDAGGGGGALALVVLVGLRRRRRQTARA